MYPGERTGIWTRNSSTSVISGAPTWTGVGQFFYRTPVVFTTIKGVSDLHTDYAARALQPATLTLNPGDSAWYSDQGFVHLSKYLPDERPALITRVLWVLEYSGDAVVEVADGLIDSNNNVATWTPREHLGVSGTSHFYQLDPTASDDTLRLGNLGVRLTCVSGTAVLTFAGVQIEGPQGYQTLNGYTWSEPLPADSVQADMQDASPGFSLTPTDQNAEGGGPLAIFSGSPSQVGVGSFGWYAQDGVDSDKYPTEAEAITGTAAIFNSGGQLWASTYGISFGVDHPGVDATRFWGTISARIDVAVAPQRVPAPSYVVTRLNAAGLKVGSDYLDWEYVDTDFGIQDWLIKRTLYVYTSSGAIGESLAGNVEVRLLGNSLPNSIPATPTGQLLATVFHDGGVDGQTPFFDGKAYDIDVDLGSNAPMIVVTTVDTRYASATVPRGGTIPVDRGNTTLTTSSRGILGRFRQPGYRYKIPIFVPGPTLTLDTEEPPAGYLLNPLANLDGDVGGVDVNFG